MLKAVTQWFELLVKGRPQPNVEGLDALFPDLYKDKTLYELGQYLCLIPDAIKAGQTRLERRIGLEERGILQKELLKIYPPPALEKDRAKRERVLYNLLTAYKELKELKG